MARRKELNKNNPPHENTLITFLLFLPRVLITIGDGIRFMAYIVFHLVSTTITISGVVVRESARTANRWIQRKRTTRRFAFKLPSFRWPKMPALPKFKKRLRPLPLPPAVVRIEQTKTEQIKSFIAGVCVTVLFFFLPYNSYLWLTALPNPQLLTRRDLEVTTKIFDRNGVLLYEIYTDQNRTPLPLSQIPKFMQEATISIEDKDFYKHPGFSVTGIMRAARETILNKNVQGGSTITQQLIKSALLSPEINLTRKIKEIILAFWAERIYTKNQVLEMYLNQVPYGGTAWGIEAASQTYFGTSVSNLNLAELALLAGLPAAPTEYSPFGSHPEKAFERQKEVLRRMTEDRYITPKEEQEALATPIQFTTPRVPIRAPHFVMYIKDILEKQYGPRLVEQGGLRITTSLDSAMQEKVENIVRTQVDSLSGLRVGNGAALVTNPKTGEILAMVGSKNYFDVESDGNVNVTTSLRQPGSSIKVVNYAAALENATPAGGQGFTAATILDDSPVVYQIPGSTPYAPVNYDGKFHGSTPLRYALGNSYNIPAVKTLARIGVATMVEKGRAMGIGSWTDSSRFGLSLTLGGGEVTMLDMARVFGTLANSGYRTDLQPILEITDYAGHVLKNNTPKQGIQAVKPEVAWIMSNILSDNTARMAAFGPNSSLVIPGKTVSVKTGTTDNKRDNWTIGYTPSLLTAVWVGNNNNAPMDPFLTSGITGAAPIWHDIMTELLKDKPDEVALKPDTVISLPCYFNRPEYFIKGTEPPGGRCVPIPTPAPSPSPTP
ncbi:MAG: transglycosylase domain-containing protein [Candidatus Gottesmanbacteria bacterium]|nr:transglycosylase domain-containing protein [Candidatus Gottesmanbacteria bacterium]